MPSVLRMIPVVFLLGCCILPVLAIDQTEIPDYLSQVRNGADEQARLSAVTKLTPFAGDPRVTLALLAVLKGSDRQDIRAQAVSALGKQADPQVAQALLRYADDKKSPLRVPATISLITQLHGMQHAAVTEHISKVIAGALRDKNVQVRRAVSAALCREHERVSWPVRLRDAVLAATRDTDAVVRRSAVAMLADTPSDPSRALPALQTALHDADVQVADTAQASLLTMAQMHPEQREQFLALARKWSKDSDVRVRAVATGLMGVCPDAAMLADLQALLADTAVPVRGAAMQACRRWAQSAPSLHTALQGMIPQLVTLTKDADASTRASALHALGAIGDAGTLDVLLSGLLETDPGVRAAAVTALGGFSEPRVTHALEKTLYDTDSRVRQDAAQALANSTDPAAVKTLLAALDAPYRGIRIWLDAGHGGSESGAVANGFQEKNINLPITLACKDVLEQHGIKVGLTRLDDSTVDLYKRCALANSWGANYFVSIHNNATGSGRGDGVEAIHSIFADQGTHLTAAIVDSIMSTIGQNPRSPATYSRLSSSRDDDYYCVIRETNMPAIIVECAFVDNADDVQMVNTPEKQRRMGEAIANGILQHLGLVGTKSQVDAALADERDADAQFAMAMAAKTAPDPRVTDVLVGQLANTQHRAQAATALMVRNDPRAARPLLLALAACTPEQQSADGGQAFNAVLDALRNFGTPATDAMLAGVDDADADVRFAAVNALYWLPDPRAVPALQHLAHDAASPVRWRAVGALAKIADVQSADVLQHALTDSCPDVRLAAVDGIGAMRDQQAVQPLIALLTDQDPRIPPAAAKTLTVLTGKQFGNDQSKWRSWTATEKRPAE
ncbi:MAG TPA: HEAT repeat domain-containing protein [Armatimonadota bacterium]|nr:HEAT repeat domain-containing protein [Armatimonadota bacterium]